MNTPRLSFLPGAAPALLAVALAIPALAQNSIVVFVHDQSSDEILRLEDLNGDGDAHDPGETTLFFDDSPPITGVDNAQGMVALNAYTLLATDNFSPDNIVLLQDLDRNGDAFGIGENAVWFDGALPIGLTMTNPAELRRRSDGTYYLLDNNTLDTTRPEAIYILSDINADSDVNDAGEALQFFELSPTGIIGATTFDVIEDASGNVYVLDITDPNQIESIDIIDPEGVARTEWLSSSTLFALRTLAMGSTFELERVAATDEIVFGAFGPGSSQFILAARDNNGSGTINLASEIRVLWSESGSADGFSTGSPRDFVFAPDGSLFWTDALEDRIMRLKDLNNDGDFQDLGETSVYFDAAEATASGLPTITLPLSLAVSVRCLADLADPVGSLDFSDVVAFLAAFGAMDPAADLAEPFGSFDFSDVVAFLGAFGAGCP